MRPYLCVKYPTALNSFIELLVSLYLWAHVLNVWSLTNSVVFVRSSHNPSTILWVWNLSCVFMSVFVVIWMHVEPDLWKLWWIGSLVICPCDFGLYNLYVWSGLVWIVTYYGLWWLIFVWFTVCRSYIYDMNLVKWHGAWRRILSEWEQCPIW